MTPESGGEPAQAANQHYSSQTARQCLPLFYCSLSLSLSFIAQPLYPARLDSVDSPVSGLHSSGGGSKPTGKVVVVTPSASHQIALTSLPISYVLSPP